MSCCLHNHVRSHVLFEMDDCSSDCSSLGLLRLCGGVALATKKTGKVFVDTHNFSSGWQEEGKILAENLKIPTRGHKYANSGYCVLSKLTNSCITAVQQWVVSCTFQIVQILVHSQFDLVSLLGALEATELATQMALELILKHLTSVQQKR